MLCTKYIVVIEYDHKTLRTKFFELPDAEAYADAITETEKIRTHIKTVTIEQVG